MHSMRLVGDADNLEYQNSFINDEGIYDLMASRPLIFGLKLNLLMYSGLPNVHGYGALRTDSPAYIPSLRRELPVPFAKRDKTYSGKSRADDERMSTVQPRVLTDKSIAMHKTLEKDWAADLAFDESERAELLLLLPRYANAKDRPLLGNVLPQLAAAAASLIRRACLPRPAAAANLGAGPLGVAGSNYTPRSTGSAAGSAVTAAAAAAAGIDAIRVPVEGVASIRVDSSDTAPGLRAAPCARASLLAAAARRAAALLPKTARRLPAAAAALLRALGRPRLDGGSPSAGEKGRADGRPAMERRPPHVPVALRRRQAVRARAGPGGARAVTADVPRHTAPAARPPFPPRQPGPVFPVFD